MRLSAKDNPMNKAGIYAIRNILDNKKYIGSAVKFRVRKSKHFSMLRHNKHNNIHLQRAYNKYGSENFVFEIIEFVEDLSLLEDREDFWFWEFDFHKELYNINPKANSWLGAKHSEKTKQKLSKIMTGRKHTKKTRKLMSESHKGKKRPPMSKEHRKKLSDGRKDKKPVAQINIDTGEIVAIFDSACHAARETNIDRASIANVCANKVKKRKGKEYVCKSAGGYKWKFVKNLE